MDNILLITNGNMGGTAGDATLVLRRSKAIYNEKGIFTHILLYKPVKQGNINNGDYYYDISTVENESMIKKAISSFRPKYVVLYGDKILLMTKKISRYIKKEHLGTKVILDIQGAVEEKKEYGDSFIRRKIFYPIALLNFKKSVNAADGAFVVSDELKGRCVDVRKSQSQDFRFFKIRCGVDELKTCDDIEIYRTVFRNKKNISNDTIVFCYSGYRVPWQKVDEIIDIFVKLDKSFSNCYFAFFCNIDDAFLEKLKTSFPNGNFCAELLNPDIYFESLCGCDVGFILRDYNETNRVAFPNKFSDYLVSGLLIALNNALPEPMRLIRKNENHYVDTDSLDVELLMNKALIRQKNYKQFLQESLELCESELLYNSQVRKLDI